MCGKPKDTANTKNQENTSTIASEKSQQAKVRQSVEDQAKIKQMQAEREAELRQQQQQQQ